MDNHWGSAAAAPSSGIGGSGGGQDAVQRPSIGELQAALGAPESPESSEADEVGSPNDVEEDLGPATDETARRMLEKEAKQLKTMERLRRRKRRLREKLATYQRKEMEFVAQMDSHMDEVERTEHALTLRIEQLTAENNQLRSLTDKRARDNTELADKLAETTKQCNESETRVQFLVDRIVALLSTGPANPEQTQSIVKMREREREMLQQLEDTRSQYDEVRQQNVELTSRLTEELALSRRLSDQLAEVEERFFHNRSDQLQPLCGADIAASLPPRGVRLGPRTLGLRGDEAEAALERIPLAERGPGMTPSLQFQEAAPLHGGMPEPLSLGKQARPPSQLGVVHEVEPVANPAGDGSPPLSAGDTGGRYEADAWQTDEHASAEHPKFQFRSRTAVSSEGLQLMEEKLRDALDRASFECPVVRVEPGIYNFGPSVQAVVELTPDGEAIASRDGGPFLPIEDFIRCVAREGSQIVEDSYENVVETPNVTEPPPAEIPSFPQSTVVPKLGAPTPPLVHAASSNEVPAAVNGLGEAARQPQPWKISSPSTSGAGISPAVAAAVRPTPQSPRQPAPLPPRPVSTARQAGAAVRAASPVQQEAVSSECGSAFLQRGEATGGHAFPPSAVGAASQGVAAKPQASITPRTSTPGRAAVSQPVMASHLMSPRGAVASPAANAPRHFHPAGSATIPAGPLVPHGPAGVGGSPLTPSPMRLNMAQSSPGRQMAPGPTPGMQPHVHFVR